MTWNWIGGQPHVVFPFESVLRWVPVLSAGTSAPITNTATSAKVTATYRWQDGPNLKERGGTP